MGVLKKRNKSKSKVGYNIYDIVIGIVGVIILIAIAQAAIYLLPGISAWNPSPGSIDVIPSRQTRVLTKGSNPAIAGPLVTFEMGDGSENDVFAYDIEADWQVPVAVNDGRQIDADINGRVVVYQDDSDHAIWEVKVYNFDSGITFSIPSGQDRQIEPVVSNDYIVYSGDFYINLCITSVMPLKCNRIDSTSGGQRYPDIDGDVIVWEDGRYSSDHDIYMYNIQTEVITRITNASGAKWRPKVSGNKIVWMDGRNGEDDVYMYNIDTGIETKLSPSGSNQMDPDIDGNKVVWVDDRHGSSDIYIYDVLTSKERRITVSGAMANWPAIDGSRVVWQEDRSGESEIWLYSSVL